METNHPKHFVLQLGAMASLYLSVIFLLVLLFNLIHLGIPDPAEGYWEIESASQNVRLGIAMLLVFFPTYLLLTRLINQARRAENATRSQLAKWLLYISLFVGAGAILINLVMIILAFLNGELTTRFILKSLALLVIVGAAVYYYAADAKDYWQTNERASLIFGGVMSAVVVASLVAGLMNIETPASVREMKLDEKQVNDLKMIESQIINFYTTTGALPQSIEDLPSGNRLPTASEGRAPYEYILTDNGYELCAEFAFPSTEDKFLALIEYDDSNMPVKGTYNWSYEAGRYCFERIIN